MSANDRPRRLYRSRSNRYIAGVCGGVAEYFGWDPTLIRLLTLASLILPGTQVIVYIIAWVVMPNEPHVGYA